MVSLIVILTFFWMIVLLYPASILLLSFGAYLMKVFGEKGGDDASEMRRRIRIDAQKDHLKEIIFKALVILTFFVISPSVVMFYYFMK